MDTLELFKNESDFVSFSENDVIFKEGDTGDLMYVIVDGDVEITVAGISMLMAHKGDILGEMALIEKNPRSATTTARTDCKLIPVDRKRFSELVQKYPMFSIHVMRVLADRLRRMNDMLRK